MRRRASGTLASLLPILCAVATGCAPHPVERARIDAHLAEERFRTSLAMRAAKGLGVEAEVSVWLRVEHYRDLPGATARIWLAAPDAFRVRLDSAFGTALDLAALGDSVSGYAPANRLGLMTAAAGESLGFSHPGALAWRALGAIWDPPAGSWSDADTLPGGARVRWEDERGMLEMTVNEKGLPDSVVLWRESGAAIVVRYRAWAATDRVMWPSLIEATDANASFKVTCRVQRVRFTPALERTRFRVRIPGEATLVTRAMLKAAIEQWTGF